MIIGFMSLVALTTYICCRLKGTGPDLGFEVIGVVLFAVALQDVERLQTHRFLKQQ